MSTSLNAQSRRQALARLQDNDHVWDVLVIGGGITGAGVALDAASRGLSVALVEKHDLAFGTSRWSSKLAHGGLRYLASGNVGIARRSALERGLLLTTIAPHLTRTLPQVVPVLPGFSLANKILPRLGFLAGDFLRIAAGTPSRILPRSRTIGAKKVRELAPTVTTHGLRFGYLNYDGQLLDDARLVTAIARTAAAHGASIITHAGVGAINTDGALPEVEIFDALDDGYYRTRARHIINATGVWAGELADDIRIRPSRGTHLVVNAAKLGNPTGSLTVPIPGETNRFVFVLPAPHRRVYIGLTDEPHPGAIPDEVVAPESDVEFLLSVINTALASPLQREDVLATFAGLRPLIDAGEAKTADLSREHAILETAPGVLTVTGGKLTEYRLMAEQTVDKVAPKLPCRTKQIPLLGAGAVPPKPPAAPADIWETLVARYGCEAEAVVKQCTNPFKPVFAGADVYRCEFAWFVTHEGALTVSDMVDRRCRLGLVAADFEAARKTAEEILALAENY